MALVAEQVGQQPIDFKSGVGEVVKGAAEAAGLYGAMQKAEATKLEIENAKMKQDSMKSGIFLDYMDKIANSPNPAVQKVLKKQYAMQHEKMYGQPMDPQTLDAISNSPKFGEAMQKLIEDGTVKGNGASYIQGINTIAKSLGLPYVDAEKQVQEALKMMSQESVAATKKSGTDTARKSYELRETKAVQEALKQAEEDKQVQDFGVQLVGANKGLEMLNKAFASYQKTGKTITYGQLAEIQTDLAALQAVKPSAVIPIAREKKLDIDISAIDRGLNELLTNISVNPQQEVPLSNLRLLKSQLTTIKDLMQIAHDRELDRGYSRGKASGLLTQDIINQRKKDLANQFNTDTPMGDSVSQTSSSAVKTMTPREMIKAKKSFAEVNAAIKKSGGKEITLEQYKAAGGQ